MSNEEPTHAGGVVYREGAPPRYLVVRPRRRRDEWVLPKGHVEPGETTEAAALREVREETGVEAELVAPLGAQSYETSGGDEVRVRWFLMRHLRSGAAEEDRDLRWLPFGEAREHLTFAGTRDLLERAERARRRAEGAA